MRDPVLRLLAAVPVLVMCAALAAPAAAASEPVATPAPALQPCVASDLSLREVSAPAAPDPSALYALENTGSAACRISGGVGIRLFDPDGKPIPLRFAPRTAMALLLTLAPGQEASFTVTTGPHASGRCAPSARIEVFVAPQPVPVAAKTAFVVCAGGLTRVSNLQLGVPSAVPSAPASLSPSAKLVT
jgi:uncharacterized protein DUF4232